MENQISFLLEAHIFYMIRCETTAHEKQHPMNIYNIKDMRKDHMCIWPQIYKVHVTWQLFG